MNELQGKFLTGLIAYFFGIVTMITKDRLEPKAKVVWWNLPKSMLFQVPTPSTIPLVNSSTINTTQLSLVTPPQSFFNIFTSSIFIQNIGKKAALDIEICHKRRPEHFMLFPSRGYEEEFTPDGAHIIKVKSLGQAELLIVEYLAFTVGPELNYIRADNRHCEKVDCYYQRRVSPWLLKLLWLLIMVGVGSLITLLVMFILTWAPPSWRNLLSGIGIK